MIMTQLDRLRHLKEDVLRIAGRHKAGKIYIFGSCARGEETPESDVDILVQFDHGRPIGLLRYARMWREIEELIGRKVDLVEDGTLMPFAVESANRDKQLIYERT